MYRKNVAGQNLPFALVNATNGAALTGATVTARRSIDGGAQAAATGTVSELANGQYNLALSQADTNGNQIGILLTATNAIPVHFTLVTTAGDPTDAVRLGLTALPNAAAEAAGGLYTRGTGAGQINQAANGQIDANLATWVGSAPNALVAGRVDSRLGSAGSATISAAVFAAGAIDANVIADNAIDAGAIATGAITAAKFAAGAIDAAAVADGAIDAATFAAGAINAAAIAADAIGASELAADAVAEIADAVWDEARAGHIAAGSFGEGVASVQGNVTGSVASVTGAVASVTGNVGGNVAGSVASVTAAVTVGTNNDKTGYALTSAERTSVADALLDRDMSTGTDSGTAVIRTVRQALRALRNRAAIAAGTLTVYKENDTTASWTATATTAAGNPVTEINPADS